MTLVLVVLFLAPLAARLMRAGVLAALGEGNYQETLAEATERCARIARRE